MSINSKRNLKYVFILAIAIFSTRAFADFGEIDLIAHESIENHFREYNQDVKMNTLVIDQYKIESANADGQVLGLYSSVKAYNEDYNQNVWYTCKTMILMKPNKHYQDQGTYCEMDSE